jgi:hypothetical protein
MGTFIIRNSAVSLFGSKPNGTLSNELVNYVAH